MGHTYIDLSRLYDFSEKLTFDDVSADFDKYHIHNILDEDNPEPFWVYEEYRYYLEEALWDDYQLGRINYRAYIEEGMDARFMMELRKSALLRIEGCPAFYSDHSKCETVDDIRNLRLKYPRQISEDYEEFDWQLYMLIRWCWTSKGTDIVIDYESCFDDGDYHKEGNPEHYRRAFLEGHIPRERIIPMGWP